MVLPEILIVVWLSKAVWEELRIGGGDATRLCLARRGIGVYWTWPSLSLVVCVGNQFHTSKQTYHVAQPFKLEDRLSSKTLFACIKTLLRNAGV